MAELTPKREAFAKNFIENGGNATDAARKAGYKKPEQEGCRLLKNADVSAYIADKQAELDSATAPTQCPLLISRSDGP